MSDTTCRCGRPTRDAAFVCDDCSRSLAMVLAEVPWLEGELATTVAGLKGVDYRTRGGTGTGTGSLVAWVPAEARADLRAVLVSWTLFCRDEHVRNQSATQELPEDTLEAVASWLAWRVDGLSLLDVGPDAVEEITTVVDRCRRIVDRPADREYSGRCGAVTEVDGLDVTCERDLYARPAAKFVTCSACGTTWDVARRRALLLTEARDVLATAVEISRAVSLLGAEPLTADRVRQWAARKRLTVRGHDWAGKATYRVGDAIDLLAGVTPDSGMCSPR